VRNFVADKPTRQEIIDRLKHFFAAKPEVVLVYVYGSFLRREDWRDLDVAVLIERGAPDAPDPFNQGLRLAAELEEFLGRPRVEVDLRMLNEASLAFQYEVIKTGELVVRRDERTRILYESRVVIEYLDFAPILAMYEQTLLEEIQRW
jgi:hypothetical protein